MSIASKQGEMYGFITGFMWPPRPMTAEEYAEWWAAERAPIIRAAGVTVEEATAAAVLLAKAFAGSERERGPMIPED